VHPKDAGEYAVHERDLTFNVADQFAGWWSTSGWIFHRETPEGFANWWPARYRRPWMTTKAAPWRRSSCQIRLGRRFATDVGQHLLSRS
jgi:hypothetical protein